MKKIVLLLLFCSLISFQTIAQINWFPATIQSQTKTLELNAIGPFYTPPSRPINVEFSIVNDTLILIDSFAGNCTDNFLAYEYTGISNDSMKIRKADSGIVAYSCCKPYYFGFTNPDSIYYYKNNAKLFLLNSTSPINIQYEGLWYKIQKVNSNTLSYSPKYILANAIDSVTLGHSPGLPYSFSIDSGYIWFNYNFQADDGSAYYYQISDKVNDTIFINSYAGTCQAVTLNLPGHYVSIPIMPCDSLTGTLYIKNISRPYEWTSNESIVEQYYVKYAPFATVCDTSSNTVSTAGNKSDRTSMR